VALSQPTPGSGTGGLADRDVTGLLFVADMYGVQLDQLAGALGASEPQARAAAARWRRAGYAETARIGPGRAWVWLTRAGLAACGLPYRPVPPALSRLAHLRAVTAVRLALESAGAYQQAAAYWRSERRLRARAGSRAGLREHLPDGEVHWPDGAGVPWAGECWAIEAELTRKTVARTAGIMREILARTGDYGCAAADARVAGRPPRHARVVYACSPAALPTVTRARTALGALAGRVETRLLPPSAAFTAASVTSAAVAAAAVTSADFTSTAMTGVAAAGGAGAAEDSS
jgi:hypothetical protein